MLFINDRVLDGNLDLKTTRGAIVRIIMIFLEKTVLLESDSYWRWRGFLLLSDERKNTALFYVFLVVFRTRTITVTISVRLVYARSSMRTNEESRNIPFNIARYKLRDHPSIQVQ